MQYCATRYHDICAGHRVVGHEGKCRHLHGHNYRIHFHITTEPKTNPLDAVGRVLDFSEIKLRLCEWLEENWDHKFIVWNQDRLMQRMAEGLRDKTCIENDDDMEDYEHLFDSLVWVDFNPTAENLAAYLLHEVGPRQLKGTGAILTGVVIDETRKCSVGVAL